MPSPLRKAFFITGTDTDVGKTFACLALLAAARRAGLSTVALKPLAAGARETAEGLRNDDALALQAAATRQLLYEEVNPVCFAPAIAPHIAARQAGRSVSAARLAGFCRAVLAQRAELTLIEGAGGWCVPLNERELLSQLPRELKLPVILVVGLRLGCLNHALLTARAIVADGLQLAGWIANDLGPELPCRAENLDTLRRLLPAPLLAELPWVPDADPGVCAPAIDLEALLSP